MRLKSKPLVGLSKIKSSFPANIANAKWKQIPTDYVYPDFPAELDVELKAILALELE